MLFIENLTELYKSTLVSQFGAGGGPEGGGNDFPESGVEKGSVDGTDGTELDYDAMEIKIKEGKVKLAELEASDSFEDPDDILEDGFKSIEVDTDGDGVVDSTKIIPDFKHPRWNSDDDSDGGGGEGDGDTTTPGTEGGGGDSGGGEGSESTGGRD